MNPPALKFWTGKTVHCRFTPFERRFEYGIFLIDVDIDLLAEAGQVSSLFAVGRPSLFSFRPEDNGPRSKETTLREWAETVFQTAGIDQTGGRIRLVTFPRHLFYRFAPLSLWYGYDSDERLQGVIYEVNNTFGERHCYVAPAGQSRSQHEAEKSFHVSPFFDVSGKYRFVLQAPGDKLHVTVENWDEGDRTHMANIVARLTPATSATLLRHALTQPLSSIGVLFGIHWQALKIWLRGARYRRKPLPPASPATIAHPVISPPPYTAGESS